MEPASGVELFNRAPDQSVQFSVYRVMMTPDDDDDDEAHIREKWPMSLKKQWHYTYEKMNEMK